MRVFRLDLWLRRAFGGAAVAWAVLLPSAALVAGLPHASSMAYSGAAAVYVVGSVLCHQLPERSYHLWGIQLPVCARCLGIYVGAAMAVVAAAARDWRAIAPGREARVALAVAALPTIVTLVYEWTTGDMPGNGIRAMAGAPLGVFVAWLVVRRADAARVASEPAGG